MSLIKAQLRIYKLIEIKVFYLQV